MMQNYLDTHKQYPDCILFYRLGDFYEMFFDDAITVSRELELTLTGKSCGLEERAPMCGVPFHAAEPYIAKLVSHGHKVAVCEQVEDPKLAKGLVKREVIRVVTPGTNMNMQTLDASKNNYLFCVYYSDNGIGLCISDISTGVFMVTEVGSVQELRNEIGKFGATELVCNEAFLISGEEISEYKERYGVAVFGLEAHLFDERSCEREITSHFATHSLQSLGLSDLNYGKLAAGATLTYLRQTQMTGLDNITGVKIYRSDDYMMLDSASRRNLELTETLREKNKRGSLLWVLDKTKTAMGGRLLRSMTEQPLCKPEPIKQRYDAIDEFNKKNISRDEIREYLTSVYDLERLLTRMAYGSAGPRELVSFCSSIAILPAVKESLKDFGSEYISSVINDMDTLDDIRELISAGIIEEPPLSARDGGIIRDGFDEEVDRLRVAARDGKKWLSELEETERERTGIKNLKIKFHKSFGYFFEVTNSFKDKVPDDFIRRQTLTNAERFTTVKLKEIEDEVLHSQEKLSSLEYDIFCRISDTVKANVERVKNTADAVARLDVITSLSYVSEKNHYTRPKLNTRGIIDIKDGRHPVVEMMQGADGGRDLFVANDTYLDNDKNLVNIITGPNMAGKSTYMRQTALIVLMAQMGCFVPAASANIGVVDRIFTRVGASDDLASGQSTFMVEMNEVSNILRNATSNSLIILDEIGRGTSTFDGLSIAWAVVEHISNRKLLGAKTLFATHYHELTELEGKIDNVNNYCIAVKESGDNIVFLRKIVKGGADRSYGIQVAKLAGVPDSVINRAKEIASQLGENDITEKIKEIADIKSANSRKKSGSAPDEVDMGQMSFFDMNTDEDILKEISELDISSMTPIEAMNTLYRMQNRVNNRYMF